MSNALIQGLTYTKVHALIRTARGKKDSKSTVGDRGHFDSRACRTTESEEILFTA